MIKTFQRKKYLSSEDSNLSAVTLKRKQYCYLKFRRWRSNSR
jgi:hypothetical protein